MSCLINPKERSVEEICEQGTEIDFITIKEIKKDKNFYENIIQTQYPVFVFTKLLYASGFVAYSWFELQELFNKAIKDRKTRFWLVPKEVLYEFSNILEFEPKKEIKKEETKKDKKIIIKKNPSVDNTIKPKRIRKPKEPKDPTKTF